MVVQMLCSFAVRTYRPCVHFIRECIKHFGSGSVITSRCLTTSAVLAQDPKLSQTEDVQARPVPCQMPTLMDIGSRSIFNTDHDIFRASARKFFREEVLPHHDTWEKVGEPSREVWLKAGEQGLLGIPIAAEFGGVGGTWKDACITMEEQSYVNCCAPAFALQSDIMLPYIADFGTPEQKEKYIPDLCAGKKIGAIAMTESDAGSDLQGIRTHAKKDGDDFILNGSKMFITNGWLADVVIVVAVTDTTTKSAAHGISLFLVDAGTPGFKKGKKLNKMGLKAQDTAELYFEDIRLPKSALLGKGNMGFYHLMQELPQERLCIGVHATAHSEWMFEETRNYVKQRKAFGKTLANLQTIQHKLAEMKTEIAVTRAFVDQCIELHYEKRLDNSMASMAKYWASDLQNKVAYNCVQMHGGAGYILESPISKAFIDARVQPIFGGSNEIMKELIARTIFSDKRV